MADDEISSYISALLDVSFEKSRLEAEELIKRLLKLEETAREHDLQREESLSICLTLAESMASVRSFWLFVDPLHISVFVALLTRCYVKLGILCPDGNAYRVVDSGDCSNRTATACLRRLSTFPTTSAVLMACERNYDSAQHRLPFENFVQMVKYHLTLVDACDSCFSSKVLRAAQALKTEKKFRSLAARFSSEFEFRDAATFALDVFSSARMFVFH